MEIVLGSECGRVHKEATTVCSSVTECLKIIILERITLEQWSPNRLAPRTSFVEDDFYTDWGGAMVWG